MQPQKVPEEGIVCIGDSCYQSVTLQGNSSMLEHVLLSDIVSALLTDTVTCFSGTLLHGCQQPP